MSHDNAVPFRAEMRQLLHILTHSLYSDREIFLRELLSNAADAINRVRFVQLTSADVRDPDLEPGISIRVDADANTITDLQKSTAPASNPLPLPRSFTSYPLRLPFEGSMMQAIISDRRISPHGTHEWKVQLPVPHEAAELWIDTQTLHSHIAKARKNCKINAPSSSPPTLFALKSFDPILHGTKWTKNHASRGEEDQRGKGSPSRNN